MYKGFDLCTFFKKFNRVIQLEIEIMIVGIGAKANLFNNCFLSLCLDLLLLFLLLVFELGIIDDLTNRGICFRRDLYKVQTLLSRNIQRLLNSININFYIISD